VSIEVKICGLTTPDMIDAAIDAGADYIGLVSFPKSPRHVGLDTAADLAAHAQMRAHVVVLTVDASDAHLADIAADVGPDFIQLHGHETPARVRDVAERTACKTIKAIPIETERDVPAAATYADVADLLLFDAKPPPASDLPGGNGEPFDWDLLAKHDWRTPTMLSGGLTVENVTAAIARTGTGAVDVSSGVERARGIKDAALIRAFVAAAKAG